MITKRVIRAHKRKRRTHRCHGLQNSFFTCCDLRHNYYCCSYSPLVSKEKIDGQRRAPLVVVVFIPSHCNDKYGHIKFYGQLWTCYSPLMASAP